MKGQGQTLPAGDQTQPRSVRDTMSVATPAKPSNKVSTLSDGHTQSLKMGKYDEVQLMNSSYAKRDGCGLILVQATDNTQTSIT